MWPISKTFVVSNPWVVAIGVAVFLAWSGGCVGYGYVKATKQYESVLLEQQEAVGAAQHQQDVAEHNRAVAENKVANLRKQAGQTHIATVQTEIAALPAFTSSEACAPNDDVVRLLNEAGK